VLGKVIWSKGEELKECWRKSRREVFHDLFFSLDFTDHFKGMMTWVGLGRTDVCTEFCYEFCIKHACVDNINVRIQIGRIWRAVDWIHLLR
jgi:hypothetical protein